MTATLLPPAADPATERPPEETREQSAHRLSVAPMMDCTDRHCRTFHRQLTRHALLYTEMVTTGAILRGDRHRWLARHPAQDPVALQLGGDDPADLARCARIAEGEGFAEVDLNVGCPSSRVRKGRFGACLMLEPERVAEAVAAMRAVVSIPVTVKHRLGVDDHDGYEDVAHFVSVVAASGCDSFVVHARMAWLEGLSPRQNRNVPPLRYDDVYRLKRDFPQLRIELNGGVESIDEALDHLRRVDGVMLGRAAYRRPYLLADVDRRIFGDASAAPPSRAEVVEAMAAYVDRQVAAGVRFHQVGRHLLGLFHGCPGARRWKRALSEEGRSPTAAGDLLRHAYADLTAC